MYKPVMIFKRALNAAIFIEWLYMFRYIYSIKHKYNNIIMYLALLFISLELTPWLKLLPHFSLFHTKAHFSQAVKHTFIKYSLHRYIRFHPHQLPFACNNILLFNKI